MSNNLISHRIRSGLVICLVLVLLFVFSLWLRVYFAHDDVFTDVGIKYNGYDAYYHMAIVDNLVPNFPHLTQWLPYILYPNGQPTGSIHFFDWLLAGIIWILSLGKPTANIIDAISAFYPAVLGALTVIPVYFIGRKLLGRLAGIIAAALIAILPGEFLGRSILGSTDHHVAESLYSAVTILFLLLAVESAHQRQLTFKHFRRREWAAVVKPVIFSVMAGVFLSIYLLTFTGGVLFLFIIFVFFVTQFTIDHLRRRPTDYLGVVSIVLFIIPAVIFLSVTTYKLTMYPLVIALLASPVLVIVSRLLSYRQVKPVYYPLTIAGLGLVGLAIFYAISPDMARNLISQFAIFAPKGSSAQTTQEMQPLLFPAGRFTLAIAWGNFNAGFYISLISLLLLIYLVVQRGEADKTMLLVWSLIMLAATLGQRRFAYYFAVNVAVLTGYLTVFVLDKISLIKFKENPIVETENPGQDEAEIRPARKRDRLTLVKKGLTFALLLAVIAVFSLNIKPAIVTASNVLYVPSNGWVKSLAWLKANSPEPFATPDFYFELSGSSPPPTDYAILSWWDYGYWIARIAHRVPNVNPSQDPVLVPQVASYFVSQNEASANEIARKLDSAYVIIDVQMAVSKFGAMVIWAGRPPTDFFETYLLPQEGKLIPKRLYYPEYYRSMATRLYNFDGQRVTPHQVFVIASEDRRGQNNRTFKVVTSAEVFDSYEAAVAFIQAQPSNKGFRIVGIDPFISPVPLEAVQQYKLVYSSTEIGAVSNKISIPEVKVLQFTGDEVAVGR